MRLLHYVHDKLLLSDFRGKTIPPYAILSHRWSKSETLVEDIFNGTYKEKVDGYQKLRFCANQAAKDDLQYFWIDTCCIDRWNNDELSDAINSMFRWYRNAARCYVFLSDVSLLAADGVDRMSCSDWKVSFRASRWFTRGWTLQELIAPKSVEFFSREGQSLGNKASLDSLIYEITSIPLAALRNSPLDQFSTTERRRWADNRATTEEEDIVYCLLGLLGVSMPITYGEGQESARRRLQEELEPTDSAPSIIPLSRNEFFVGRESQLAELEAKLFSNRRTTTMLAIVGLGGTGKSQLALEVAYRARLNDKDCLVFWMDATDTDSLYRSYARMAQKLSIGCDNDQADIEQIVKRCLAEISTRKCLLIFDNTGGMTIRPGASSTRVAADLANFLPSSNLCSVVFTTTESTVVEALASQNIIALHKLTPDAALRMLQNRLTRPLSDTEQQEAMHLLEELLYLPLVVVQAAACINASGMTVQQYQAQLAKHKEATLIDSNALSEGVVQECSLRNTAAATLDLSMSQICYSNAVATNYLFSAACLDRKGILLDLLEAASPQEREDGIKVLAKYALITRRPAESAFDIDRLVHCALRRRLQTEGRLQEWVQRTIKQLLRLFPDHNHSERSKCRRLLPHTQYVLSHTQRDVDEERLDLAWRCAKALYSDGQYKRTEELQVQVIQARRKMLGDEHPETLRSQACLALTYCRQGRWSEAEHLQMQVRQTTKRVLSNEHPDTLTSMNDLATTYRHQEQWSKAEELDLEALQTRKRVLGKEHPHTLTSIAHLASTYSHQGRWDEAAVLQVQVMQAAKSVLGNEHPHTLNSIAHLASTYSFQGRWDEAAELQLQVMQTTQRVLGDGHPHTLASMNTLASIYRRQRRWGEAVKLQSQVTQITKQLLGSEHPDTLASNTRLASAYWHQGRWSEAEELDEKVLETRKKVLGNKHPDTLTSMYNLACTYQSQSCHDKALALIRVCFQSRQEVLGEQHPDTQSALKALNKWRGDAQEQ